MLFEDQMATYCYVEIEPGFSPSSKSSAGLHSEGSFSHSPAGPAEIQPAGAGAECATPASPYWTLTNETSAFIIRVPNESIVRLFSFLVREDFNKKNSKMNDIGHLFFRPPYPMDIVT